jgi:hypothetical protein
LIGSSQKILKEPHKEAFHRIANAPCEHVIWSPGLQATNCSPERGRRDVCRFSPESSGCRGGEKTLTAFVR